MCCSPYFLPSYLIGAALEFVLRCCHHLNAVLYTCWENHTYWINLTFKEVHSFCYIADIIKKRYRTADLTTYQKYKHKHSFCFRYFTYGTFRSLYYAMQFMSTWSYLRALSRPSTLFEGCSFSTLIQPFICRENSFTKTFCFDRHVVVLKSNNIYNCTFNKNK